MTSVPSTAATPAARPQIAYRFLLAGREVSEDAFVEELRRQGGRAQLELVDLAASEDARYRPTPAGEAAVAADATAVRG